MKIFISHSQKDKTVAIKFKELFEIFPKKAEVFLSSNIASDQIKDKEWKKNFEEHLKDCSKVVVLVTPNSLNSRWVQYEIGYAMALDKEIIPLGIKGVAAERFFLNAYNMQIVEEKDGVVKMLSCIFNMEEYFSELWCEKRKRTINELLRLCKERCVYFVGSQPKNESDRERWNQDFVNDFLNKLTEGLLEEEIKVSSFPGVSEVGKQVFETTIAKQKNDKYEISGLYQFEEIPINGKGKTIDQDAWKNTLAEFRKLYLKNKSSMIIIGGNNHTKDEYEVAKSLGHMEIFPIPCMGGFAKEQFDKDKVECKFEEFNHPCNRCDHTNEKKKECDRIDTFVNRLSQFIYINDDERES